MLAQLWISPVAAGGDSVVVWTNGVGALVIEGEGAMDDYASAAEVPWMSSLPGIAAVHVAETVKLGANALAGVRQTASANGMVLSDLFAAVGRQDPAGAISPAEFERIEIVNTGNG